MDKIYKMLESKLVTYIKDRLNKWNIWCLIQIKIMKYMRVLFLDRKGWKDLVNFKYSQEFKLFQIDIYGILGVVINSFFRCVLFVECI